MAVSCPVRTGCGGPQGQESPVLDFPALCCSVHGPARTAAAQPVLPPTLPVPGRAAQGTAPAFPAGPDVALASPAPALCPPPAPNFINLGGQVSERGPFLPRLPLARGPAEENVTPAH